ncbi:MAG: UvrB/UvrC motif-containing protein, partial [Ruminiclostridium sp.]|nr:UvrB/UvrC motif-containing protein [Ruminiclostridium sp.]
LRSERSLTQTAGRAARNINGKVIMYADTVTDSMERAITETNRRRTIQMKYNEEHGIIPKTIVKEVRDIIEISAKDDKAGKKPVSKLTAKEKEKYIESYTSMMKEAARVLDFEQAAYFRDKIKELRGEKK